MVGVSVSNVRSLVELVWSLAMQNVTLAVVLTGVSAAQGGVEACPDLDGNGVPDECDPDCDGDGQPNAYEIQQGAADCNGNGVPDTCDLASGDSADQEGDGIPDECQLAGLGWRFSVQDQ